MPDRAEADGESLITEDLRRLVGREYPPVVYEVDRSGIRLFARAVGYTDPKYYDEAAARAAGHPTLPAPPGFLGVPRYHPDAPEYVGPPLRGLHPALTHTVAGGAEYEYFQTVYAGDVLIAVSRLAALEQRDSKALGPMLLISRETTYTRGGEVMAVLRATTMNYR